MILILIGKNGMIYYLVINYQNNYSKENKQTNKPRKGLYF